MEWLEESLKVELEANLDAIRLVLCLFVSNEC
jgi:hypothetical protein